jgi:hypothetical protein
MADTAAWLVDRVFPEVPVRQWVVRDPELCATIRRIVVRAIRGFYVRRGKARGIGDPRTGAVSFTQRFDQALRLSVHLHQLWVDGTFDGTDFHRDDPLEDHDVERLVATIRSRVLRLLRRRGLESDDGYGADEDLEPSPLTCITAAAVQGKLAFGSMQGAPAPRLRQAELRTTPHTKKKLCAECDGFTLHAAVRIPEHARQQLERLARYAARPPLAHDKLSLTADGQRVLCKFRRPFRDGTTHVVLGLHDFIARLAALIPRPRKHLVTYHGILAPAASRRDRVVPDPPDEHYETKSANKTRHACADEHPSQQVSRPRERRAFSWSELLKRVYRIEALICSNCGGARRVLAAIMEREPIRKVLAHLGLPTDPPAIALARPPPGLDDPLFA